MSRTRELHNITTTVKRNTIKARLNIIIERNLFHENTFHFAFPELHENLIKIVVKRYTVHVF